MSDNQQGNVGLSFPNGLGVQFSRNQISGGGGSAGISTIISTVTLTQTGDLIFATPGNSFVDIEQTTTGQHVQYINEMGGTTFINSPTMINGNVVIPHPYNFSINPANNPSLPSIVLNGNINMAGSAANITIGSNAPIEAVAIAASNISLIGSPVTLLGDSGATITVDSAFSTIELISPATINIGAPYIATATSSLQVFSSNDIEYLASNLVSFNSSNFSTLAYNTFMYSSNSYSNYNGGTSIYADGGIDPFRVPTISLISENGTRGNIEIQSKGGLFGAGLPGTLTMEAYGATNPALGLGGLININAYSGNFGEYGGLTSRVGIGAANVGMSAGAAPTFPGLAGSLTLYGQGLVSLTAGLVPPVLPQVPETLFCYGQAGVRLQSGSLLGIDAGIQLLSDTYAGTIYPLANGSNPLIIRGRTSPTAGVQLLDVERINMVSPNGFITAVSSINNLNLTSNRDISNLSTINGAPYPYITPSDTSNWALYNQVSSLSSITAVVGALSTLNVSSINGLPLGVIWYNVPAQANVNMNGFTFTNLSNLSAPIVSLSTINGTRYVPTQNWSLSPAITSVDFAGNNAGNVAELFVNDVAIGNALYFTNPNGIIDINDNALLGVSSIEALAGNQISFANAGLINISSINGQPVASPVAAFVSTATSQLNMRAFDIVSTLNLVALNEVAAPTLSGQLGILTTTLQVPQIEFLSTINGTPYVPYTGGAGWTSTAASALNMSLFDINGTQTLRANNITCFSTMTTAAVSASGNISATGTITATGGLDAPGGVNALPGAVAAATGGFTTVNTVNMNTSAINGQYANDYLPRFTFGPFATTGTVQLTYPGQYFFSGITPGVVIDMFINADTTGVATASGSSGTGNYVLTNKNSFNTSMNIYLQVLSGSVAAFVGFQIGPNVSCTFTLVRSSLGNIVYQNLNTSVSYVPSNI